MSEAASALETLLAILFRRHETSGSVHSAALQHADHANSVIQLADRYLVAGGLYSELCSTGEDAVLTNDARRYLEAQHELISVKNRSMLATLATVSAELEQAEIQPILFKGGGLLLNGAWADPGARYLSDLDLLVSESQLQRSRAVLFDLGFVEYIARIDPLTHRHIHPLVHVATETCVELHRTMIPPYLEAGLRLEEQFQLTTAIALGIGQIRVPTVSVSVFLALIHSEIIDDRVRKFELPLRAMLDIDKLIKLSRDTVKDKQAINTNADIDWDDLERRGRKMGDPRLVRRLASVYRQSANSPLYRECGEQRFERLRARFILAAVTHERLEKWAKRLGRLNIESDQRLNNNRTALFRMRAERISRAAGRFLS